MPRGRGSSSALGAAVVGICVTLLAAVYTAHASHAAAQGGWPPPLELSQSGGSTSRGPDLHMAPDGHLHVIWMEPAGAAFTVYHAGSDDQGAHWAHSVPLTPAGDRSYARSDVDAYGMVHAVWLEGTYLDELWYAPLTEASWGEKRQITYTNSSMAAPDVVATSDFVHAVWSQMVFRPGSSQMDVFCSRSAGEDWSPATSTVETRFTSLNSRIAADVAGNLHLVWEESPDPPMPHEIYYISGTVYTTETVWSLPITVSDGLAQSATTPDIVVESDDTVHLVFSVNVQGQQYVQDVYYASFPFTEAAGVSATLIPGSRVKVSQQLPTYASPAVAFWGDDQVHVAWNGWRAGDYADKDRIYYAVSEDDGQSWSEPVPVSPRDSWPDGFPSLAVDEDFVHVVWQEKVSDTDQDIYYTRRFPLKFQLPMAVKSY